MKNQQFLLCAPLAILAFAGSVQAQRSEHPVTLLEDVRISVDHRADADGYVRLRLIPDGREPIEVTVDVLRRMSENDIAQDVANALSLAVGDAYRVRRNGGEHIDIDLPRQGTSPEFSIEIAFNVPGLAISMHD